MSFSAAYVQKRTSKNMFYNQINTAIDWQLIDNDIAKLWVQVHRRTKCQLKCLQHADFKVFKSYFPMV